MPRQKNAEGGAKGFFKQIKNKNDLERKFGITSQQK